MPRSHCATSRTGALSCRASSMTGVSRKRPKSQFGSRSVLGAYVAFASGLMSDARRYSDALTLLAVNSHRGSCTGRDHGPANGGDSSTELDGGES